MAEEKAELPWDILFESPIKARYLKIGPNPEVQNYLHLRAVDVFGVRGEAKSG